MSEIDKNQHLKESVPTPDIRQQRNLVYTLELEKKILDIVIFVYYKTEHIRIGLEWMK